MRLTVLPIVLLMTALTLAACPRLEDPTGEDTDSPKVCTYDGKEYEIGAIFKDDCNTCTCQEDGTTSCTKAECLSEDVCSYNDQKYAIGDKFPAGDDCNTCFCSTDLEVLCTKTECVPDRCFYNGEYHEVGSKFTAEDGCNNCVCGEDMEVACTNMNCLPDGCYYYGTPYEVGEKFPAMDGCNTCICEGPAMVSCTEMACVNNFCEYNGNEYPVGEKFPAIDGCNACFCDDNREVYCTDDSCAIDNCVKGTAYFEPGCGGSDVMPVIVPGCYASCETARCQTGICQLTDINPCICNDGQDCCEACGSHEWLCLEAPNQCGPSVDEYGYMINSVAKSFGMCIGECRAEVSFAAAEGGECADAFFVSSTRNATGTGWETVRDNKGVLLPKANALISGLARELANAKLKNVYGCPDCADGGAAFLSLTREGVAFDLSYDFGLPPDILAKADTFGMSVMNALDTCESNEYVQVSDNCTPRND
ncbi:MAG: hypothetical protein JXR76_02130 [Deltaproteobacteria bacterium]|nr:hypothetical protein [Deltaproteobacteria bacterium]